MSVILLKSGGGDGVCPYCGRTGDGYGEEMWETDEDYWKKNVKVIDNESKL